MMASSNDNGDVCDWQVNGEAALEDIDAKDGAARGVDTSRHFSYYAFEGKTGVQRWKHEVRHRKARVSSTTPRFPCEGRKAMLSSTLHLHVDPRIGAGLCQT